VDKSVEFIVRHRYNLGMATKLPGDYIAGFVDGEGCFALKFRRDVRHERKNKPVYFYWDIEFAILLRADDKEILESIRNTLDCGKIGQSDKRGMTRYAVNDIHDLLYKIVPFFEKHQLRAKKKYDFVLWKEALGILIRYQQKNIKREKDTKGFPKIEWGKNDIERLSQIVNEMKQYKSGSRSWKWL